ncbi:lysylphosphatidylglycerol synthase transmembrane domain-containing protein [Pararhodobacter sp. SW119]|uniref:lysylphosphatidylglycerol synthase transmembrane domain-containing protein n=1 Tax=Pararhodobacter sp. SW119 TaxID=2780075 RepID=UPI001ADFC26B|nr:lysylphosphatidylglycerol synthase transmembrane domain-containing protein [Pararhodobacter sp. SW119]
MKWALRALASALVLGAVIWLVDPRAIGAQLLRADLRWMALAVGLLALQIVLSALRWKLTAGALGARLPTLWAVSEYHLAVLGNTLLPGGVLGDLGRVARMRGVGGWRLAIESVVVERMAGQVALALAVLLGLAWWFLPQLGIPGTLAVTLLAALGVVGPAWTLWALLPGSVRRTLAAAWFARAVWRQQVVLSLAVLACNLGGFWVAAAATGVELGASAALFVIPLTLLAMLLPVTVNGWGLREAAAMVLWPVVGVDGGDAVAASIGFGLAALGAAGLAILPWALRLRSGAVNEVVPGSEPR